nr:SDR family NAD(P)-dependent oxidoreductase [Sediminibacterium salmoneum]
MKKTILITGATAGFGKATAELFAASGWNCIITGRRKDRLTQLAAALTAQHSIEVLPLCFDVQNRKEVFDVIEQLPAQWKTIDVLLNNAGLALGRDSFEAANLDDWETMIDTNLKGLMYVTKAVLPLMIEKNRVISLILVQPLAKKCIRTATDTVPPNTLWTPFPKPCV